MQDFYWMTELKKGADEDPAEAAEAAGHLVSPEEAVRIAMARQ
jgi:hypothetical protein